MKMNDVTETQTEDEKVTIVQINPEAKNGQDKCPRCGATDITLNPQTGRLRCNFCRYELEPHKPEEIDLHTLEGFSLAAGAQDIQEDSQDVVTIKCTSCGAEVVLDTREVSQTRCHWCRNFLSINQQIPNGSIPDLVLPFNLPKEKAKEAIEKFVGKRKFYALPQFKKEFVSDNILGVYFPYMMIDLRAHAEFKGQAEREVRSYYVKHGKNSYKRYDADVYQIEREFDLVVDDLTIEASSDKLAYHLPKTNNIINSIMPFDTKECVVWNANYLKGYTSEKRDVNVERLNQLVSRQSLDIARHAILPTLRFYNRGAVWQSESMEVQAQHWKAIYLPVWLYSYQQKNGSKTVHYLAVNGRTEEVMGSVPIHMLKLLMVSSLLEFIGFFFWWTYLIDEDFGWLCMTVGFIYFGFIYARYRNSSARHYHEKETEREVMNVKKQDQLLKRRNGLSNSKIRGRNENKVKGAQNSGNLFSSVEDFLGSSDDFDPFLK